MATLKIYNIEDEKVLESQGLWDDLELELYEFYAGKGLSTSGGENYDFNVDVTDEYIYMIDDIADDDGNIVGRYEMRR